MCGAYGYMAAKGQFEDFFKMLYKGSKLKTRYNIRPTQEAIIVTNQDKKEVEERKFGINPNWNPKLLLINAQSETVDEKPTFKKDFESRRCVIPASFFYEWKKESDGKTAYLFKLKDDELFGLAGIYDKDGFVILTTEPNKLMEPVHNRMPVILDAEAADLWLNPDSEPDKLKSLFKPYSASKMISYPVSSLVNSAKNDFPEVTKPL